MLKLTIKGQELYDEENNEFIPIKETTLQLEHSLVSLSRWESVTHKPFLTKDQKTDNDIRQYAQYMTVTQNVDPEVYKCITKQDINKILDYIDDPMTATWFNEDRIKGRGVFSNASGEVITSEYLYYLMVEFNIPFECQKWHLNRLMTLIRVIAIKSKGNQKMSQKDRMKQYSALKAARRQPKV